MITEQQIQTYINQGGVKCPYCSSDDIDVKFNELNYGLLTQIVVCHECKKEWQDVYKLQTITDL